MTRGPSRATVAALAVATVVVGLTGAGVLAVGHGEASDAGTRHSVASGRRPTPAETAPSGDSTTGSTAAVPGPADAAGHAASSVPRGLRPVRIEVPAIGVHADLTDLGIAADGTIEVPSVPQQAGWLDTTPAPGEQGPAVIAGHVDSETGPAVFYRLSSLAPGDRIDVTRRDGSTVHFTVDGVRVYPQDRFPTAQVYGPVPGAVLRLITCGGDYVRSAGGYQDNVVVYAS